MEIKNHNRMATTGLVAAFALVFATAIPSARAAAPAEVYIVGALHSLHEQEASFTYDDLGKVIAAIKPEVMLLEVTPEELAGKLETKGRPEYPKVIWPMFKEGGPTSYAMELGQPLYGEVTSKATRQFEAFKRDRPSEHKALSEFGKGAEGILLAHWKGVADVHDKTTDILAGARASLNAALLPESASGQTLWDGAMVDAVRKAILAHPGKRILVLGSYRNRFMFVEALSGAPGANLVEMKPWFEANGFGRGDR